MKTQHCLRSFSTPESKSPYQIIPDSTFQKFNLCFPWPEMDAKVGHLQCKFFRPLSVARRFRRATAV
jgi:hypothetical protein